MPPQDRFVCTHRFRVRYVETDAMGIVHHSNYLAYFEEGRSVYARERMRPYSEFEASGYFLTVSEVSIRYSLAARYEQEIVLHTWIDVMKSRSVTFCYELRDALTDAVIVTGTTRHICVDREGKAVRIPADWRNWAPDEPQ